jgi:Mn2+/Fe2+ NRAMP family transporter
LLRRIRSLLSSFGAGLVAGASDNDPTSVATLSVIGSTTIYGLSWLVVLTLPMLLVIQVVSSRVGVLSGQSLQSVIRHKFGFPWALCSMFLVVSVNLVTIAADLEGGGAALQIIFGGDYRMYGVLLAIAAAMALIVGRYRRLQTYLRFVALVFLAYIGAGILARPDWGDVLRHTVVPSFELSSNYIAGALALLGTTLSSYVFYWETIEEEEEKIPRERLGQAQVDAATGIVFTVTIFWFITISSGATAGTSGTTVQTAEDAAMALQPIAGDLAEYLFAIGLLASALLAVPVIAATSAYVVTQTFLGRVSIEDPLEPATAPFYLAIVLNLLIGTALSLFGVPPIQLLFAAGIIGGIATPPLLATLFLSASDPNVMHEGRVTGIVRLGGWITTGIVSAACVVYVAYQLLGLGT